MTVHQVTAEVAYPFWRFHLWETGFGSYDVIDAAVGAQTLKPFTCPNEACDCQWTKPNAAQPNVHRTELPPAVVELVLYADDSPARPGNEPQPGDSDFKLQIPLSDGRRLTLHCGKVTFDNFVAMLAAYAADEADS